ncbi:hypothetical protein BD769DRAFT_1676257 [Suillus cothurnatus]|nr:hypothetical protein BD769DRAFT_1676257 [Suillus cothurnatus]
MSYTEQERTRQLSPTLYLTLDSDLTPDSDPTPSSPIISVNPAPPHPTQAPTTHVPARSDSAIGESEDNSVTIEDSDIESVAKSGDEVESNFTSNCAFHKEQGKPTLRPHPIYRGGEGVAPTLKKRQASHSVSSTDSYGGRKYHLYETPIQALTPPIYTANGKPDRKRRQLGEGNTHFQFQEDDDTIFSQLA